MSFFLFLQDDDDDNDADDSYDDANLTLGNQ